MLFRKNPPNANKLIRIVLIMNHFLCQTAMFLPGVASITKPQKRSECTPKRRWSNSSEHSKFRTVFLFKAWLKHSQHFFLTLFSFLFFLKLCDRQQPNNMGVTLRAIYAIYPISTHTQWMYGRAFIYSAWKESKRQRFGLCVGDQIGLLDFGRGRSWSELYYGALILGPLSWPKRG